MAMPPNGGSAVENTIKILAAWYAHKGESLSPVQLGTAAGTAAEAAGADKKTAASHAAKATADAGGTESDISNVQAAVLID